MQKLIGTLLLFVLFTELSFSQRNYNIRFSLDTIQCSNKIACFNVQLQTSNLGFGLAGQNYRIFYDASKATYLSGTSTLSAAYSPFTLVQNIVFNASGTGSIPFEETLGFLNYGMDLNDIAIGGMQLNPTAWTTTSRLCFDVLLQPISDAGTCLDFIWGRNGVTNNYASAFVEVSEWLSPNVTAPVMGVFYDDLNVQDGNSSCFNISCQELENNIPLCSDGMDNDGDGFVDCQDTDCIALPTLDCDEDGIPNGDDCSPSNPFIYPGALCNDNNSNTINDRYNQACACIGIQPLPGEYDIRLLFKEHDCTSNNFYYSVQLRSVSGSPINLAGQNYRLYFDGSIMSYVGGISVLPETQYSPYTLVKNIPNQNAGNTNGSLFFEETVGFLNYFIELNDTLNGGILLPSNGNWVTTSELCFNSTFSLTGTNIPCINIVWGRSGFTDEYATAFVEVAKWLGQVNTQTSIGRIYGDITQSDDSNICLLIDCDGDDVPNEDDCAPADPLIFPGGICNDLNPNTTDDRFNEFCDCVGTPLSDGEYDVRLLFKNYNCTENTFCYSVQLRSISGSHVNLAGQNYRLYFDGSKMTFASGVSTLSLAQYTAFTLTQFVDNQNAGPINGGLNFEGNLSFLNYSMDLNDVVNGGIILPSNGNWVTTSELCFRSYAPLSGTSIPCIEIVWAREPLTSAYASAYLEVSKWVGPGNTMPSTGNIYGDVTQLDITNICNITDCDDDDVPNEDDCAPKDSSIFPGAICNDGNPATINDRYNIECICTGDIVVPDLGIISGVTWHDLNGNGTRDLGDPRIPGVQVTLFTLNGIQVGSMFTDINGAYTFNHLPTNTYYVVFGLPTGFQFTFENRGSDLTDSDVSGANGFGSTDNILISGTQQSNNVDAGYFRCAKIGDNIWYDFNKNDVYDSFENGINGLRVNLWTNYFGKWIIWNYTYTGPKPNSPSSDGFFEFCAPPGQYYLEVIMPPLGLVPVLPDKGNNEQIDSDINNTNGPGTTSIFIVISEQIKDDLGAGYYPMAAVGNLVWLDENFNGIQDLYEPTVSDVMVEAYDATNSQKIGHAITDQDGRYEIDYLQKKEVFLKFAPPSGYSATMAKVSEDIHDSDVDHSNGPFTTKTFLTVPGQINENIDMGLAFGLLPLVWLGVDVHDDGNKHIVSWRTQSETKVSHFILERSVEGMKDFEVLPGILWAKGVESKINSYQMADYNISIAGTYIYRVRQVDFDGNTALSPYAQIKRLYQNSAEVHPNPINNEMKIELSLEHDAITQIYMFDNTNKIVKVILENIHLEAGESIFKINVEDIPNGHYVLLFTIDGIIITKKLVVIHN